MSETSWSPRLIAGEAVLPPFESSADRGWRGLSLEFYDSWPEFHVAEYTYTSLTLQLSGKRRVCQSRFGRTLDQTTSTGCTIITPEGEAKTWVTFGPSACRFAVLKLATPFACSVLGLEAGSTVGSNALMITDSFGTYDSRLDRLVRGLVDEYRVQDFANATAAEAIGSQVVIHLARYYSRLRSPSTEPSATKLGPRCLSRTLEFIDANLGGDLCVTVVARELSMSPAHFSRRFRLSVGMSPHQYIVQRRIHRAQDLLRYSSLPLDQIALEVGFSRPSHFSVAFRRVTHESPLRFRRAYPPARRSHASQLAVLDREAGGGRS